MYGVLPEALNHTEPLNCCEPHLKILHCSFASRKRAVFKEVQKYNITGVGRVCCAATLAVLIPDDKCKPNSESATKAAAMFDIFTEPVDSEPVLMATIFPTASLFTIGIRFNTH